MHVTDLTRHSIPHALVTSASHTFPLTLFWYSSEPDSSLASGGSSRSRLARTPTSNGGGSWLLHRLSAAGHGLLPPFPSLAVPALERA